MSDTPETDAVVEIVRNECDDVAYLGVMLFARTLERERNANRVIIETQRELIDTLKKQREELEEKVAAQEEILRDLACYLGVGGYNDGGLSDFDAAKYLERIKEGIQSFVKIEAEK